MTVSGFIMYLLGMYVEVVLLWQDAHRGEHSQGLGNMIAIPLQPGQLVLAGGVLVAVILVGVFELTGLGRIEVDISNPIPFLLFVLIGLFVLGAGVVSDHLLPRIGEKNILIVVLIAVLNILLDGVSENFLWKAALLIPSVGIMAYLVLRKTAPGVVLKSFIYLWYLVILLYLTLTPENIAFFNMSDPGYIEVFMFGVVFIFLLLHGLFAIRFFLIVSSLLLPRNRPLIGLIMPRLFSDEQVSLVRFLVVASVLSIILILNSWLGIFQQQVLLNLGVILSVQVFFRSSGTGEKLY